MANPRMLPKPHVTAVLLVHGCVRVKDYATASLWRSPNGFCFTVPREGPKELCDESTLNAIVHEIEAYGAQAFATDHLSTD